MGVDEALGQGPLGRTEPPWRMRIVLLIAELVVPAVLGYPAVGGISRDKQAATAMVISSHRLAL